MEDKIIYKSTPATPVKELFHWDSSQHDVWFDDRRMAFAFSDGAWFEAEISKVELAELCGYAVSDGFEPGEVLIEGMTASEWWPRPDEIMTVFKVLAKQAPKRIQLKIEPGADFVEVWPRAKTATALGIKVVIKI